MSITACSLRGISKLIAMIGLSFSKGMTTRLDNYNALGDADRAKVAVPAFDGMFFGVAVAAQQLHAVEADLHALVGAQPLGQRSLARERQALLRAGGAPPGDQPKPVQFDRDVGAHERDGLAMRDRLAE